MKQAKPRPLDEAERKHYDEIITNYARPVSGGNGIIKSGLLSKKVLTSLTMVHTNVRAHANILLERLTKPERGGDAAIPTAQAVMRVAAKVPSDTAFRISIRNNLT